MEEEDFLKELVNHDFVGFIKLAKEVVSLSVLFLFSLIFYITKLPFEDLSFSNILISLLIFLMFVWTISSFKALYKETKKEKVFAYILRKKVKLLFNHNWFVTIFFSEISSRKIIRELTKDYSIIKFYKNRKHFNNISDLYDDFENILKERIELANISEVNSLLKENDLNNSILELLKEKKKQLTKKNIGNF